MALLDVNALIALAWDSHVHHAAMRQWFSANGEDGWATCPVTESGFVRVSANPKVMPHPIGVQAAVEVLAALRSIEGHVFLSDDVSPADADFPHVFGHRQVTDAHLLTLARCHEVDLVTFESGIQDLSDGQGVNLLQPF
ncbi:MAG: TA system VapC family ribonuclease toxin [Solirubrobacterales bacterium]